MPDKHQPNRTKRLLYTMLLALLCAGVAVRIGFSFWQTARADAEAKKRTEYKEQHKFDWMNQYLSLAPPPPRTGNQHPCVFQAMSRQTAGPELGDCRTGWSLFSDPVDQFEVDLRYGAFVVRQTDLFLNDGFPIPFTRAYTSLDWFHPNPVHAFGRNSNHTYDVSPLTSKPPFRSMYLALEDGDFLSFERISPGESYPDGMYRHSETGGHFYNAFMYWNQSNWKTRLANGFQVLFPQAIPGKKIADGGPLEIDDAAGNKLRLERDTDCKLRQIITPHDHWIRLFYDDQGWIAKAEDDQDHWVLYSYNSDGMLTNVVYSSGKKRRYEYDGTNLTEIRDEEDNILVRNFYDQHTVIAQQFPDGRIYKYSYDSSQNRQYADSATIEFPDGTQEKVQIGASVPDFMRRIRPEPIQAENNPQ